MSYSLQRIAALELKENIAKTAALKAPVTGGLLFQNFSDLIQDQHFIDQIKNLSKSETQIKITLTHKKIVVWAKQGEIASFSLVDKQSTQKIVSEIFKTARACLRKSPGSPSSKPNTLIAKAPIATTGFPPSPVGTPHFTGQPTSRTPSPPPFPYNISQEPITRAILPTFSSKSLSTPQSPNPVVLKGSSVPTPLSPKSTPNKPAEKPKTPTSPRRKAKTPIKLTPQKKEASSPRGWSLWDVFRVAPEEQEHFGNIKLFESRRGALL